MRIILIFLAYILAISNVEGRVLRGGSRGGYQKLGNHPLEVMRVSKEKPADVNVGMAKEGRPKTSNNLLLVNASMLSLKRL